MDNSKDNLCICRSVFKSGGSTVSKKQFTQMWIGLVNRIEKGKGVKIEQKN